MYLGFSVVRAYVGVQVTQSYRHLPVRAFAPARKGRGPELEEQWGKEDDGWSATPHGDSPQAKPSGDTDFESDPKRKNVINSTHHRSWQIIDCEHEGEVVFGLLERIGGCLREGQDSM